MKKIISILLLLAVLLAPSHFARAEGGPSLDEGAILKGMGGSWQQGYGPVVRNDIMTLHLPLTGEASEKIIAELIAPDNSPFTGEGLKGEFTKNSDGIWPVVFKARLSQVRTSGDYPCILRITTQDNTLHELPITLAIRDGKTPPELVSPVITLSKTELAVGEAGTLDLTLTNPDPYAALTSITLTIHDASGDILPAVSDVIRTDMLLPEESQTLSIPVHVRADADISLHRLTMKVSYCVLETSGFWEETFTLPVTQTMRMELGRAEMATTVLQKDTATLVLPVMNLGRGELRNVAVCLSLPGITEGQTVLVGTVAPGETGRAQISFTPDIDILGDVEGTLLVTGEDAWGNKEEKSIPVSITVEKAIELVAIAVEEVMPPGSWIPWLLGGVCLLLAILLILQGTLLRKRIHRLEEERL